MVERWSGGKVVVCGGCGGGGEPMRKGEMLSSQYYGWVEGR